MNWQPSVDRGYSRLGVVVSKRVGKAVTRSRTRRLLREAFREMQHQILQPVDIVLVARKMIVGRRQSEVRRDLGRLLKRAGVMDAAS